MNGFVFGTGTSPEITTGPPSKANPVITWETQTTKNIGVETQFANGLLFLNFDYFYNIRDNILAKKDASVPDFTGLTLPDDNIAQVDNKGFEVEAGIRKKINSDWNFSLSGNLGYSKNELVFIDEVEPPVPWQRRTGYPYGTRLMYDAIGIFRDKEHVNSMPRWTGAGPGDIIFRNVRNEHLEPGQTPYTDIMANDRIMVDHTVMPNLFYGVSFDITWKNFTLSTLLQGQGKYLKKNFADDRRGEGGNYFKWMYEDRWTPTNPNGTNPRAWDRANQYWTAQENTFFWDNTAYLRLKNLVLSYSVPNKYYKSVGISNININLSGNNLAYLWSGTKKFDPEVDNANSYPTMKTFAIGANITF